MKTEKVLLLGDIGVGKSSLARRLLCDTFDADYVSTIGADVFSHELIAADGTRLRVVLWDTDGAFDDRLFETAYPAGATAAVIVADATRPTTRVAMERLVACFNAAFPGRPALRVVNKSDLAPDVAKVSRQDEFVLSARSGDGVDAFRDALAQTLLR